jgi:3-mercaptopyruvate sulfurtransferase SseA
MMSNKKINNLLVAVFLIFGAPACNAQLPGGEPSSASTLPVAPTHEPGWLPQTDAEVPRVGIQDTLAAIENGEAVIVDVRSTAAYEDGHIAGAISIPLEVIQANPEDIGLDKDQWIITYCT